MILYNKIHEKVLGFGEFISGSQLTNKIKIMNYIFMAHLNIILGDCGHL
jgi:hypothetical protein